MPEKPIEPNRNHLQWQNLTVGTEPTPNYSISTMRPDDTEPFHDLIHTSHLENYVNEGYGVTADKINEHFSKSTPEERRENSERRADDPNHQAWVAKDAQQNIIGLSAAVKLDYGTYILTLLHIKQEWHGKGLAHDLLAQAMEWLDSEHNDIELGVAIYNERAKAFYRKYGFEEVPGSERLYNNYLPSVLMIRKAPTK